MERKIITRFGIALLTGAMAVGSSLVAEPTAPSTVTTDTDLGKTSSAVASRSNQASTSATIPVVPPAVQRPLTTARPNAAAEDLAKTHVSMVATPMTGEQINWKVISGGGQRGNSTNYGLSITVGQTAVGPGSSTNYKTNLGFWQNLSTSCCVGKRGNVNCTGIVDLGDLQALVSYLTGSGFVLCCYDAANVDGLGIVDLGDLSALASYLTGGGFVLPNCP